MCLALMLRFSQQHGLPTVQTPPSLESEACSKRKPTQLGCAQQEVVHSATEPDATMPMSLPGMSMSVPMMVVFPQGSVVDAGGAACSVVGGGKPAPRVAFGRRCQR